MHTGTERVTEDLIQLSCEGRGGDCGYQEHRAYHQGPLRRLSPEKNLTREISLDLRLSVGSVKPICKPDPASRTLRTFAPFAEHGKARLLNSNLIDATPPAPGTPG